MSINSRAFEAFFPTEALRMQIRRPLVLTETTDKFDVLATVDGGGVSGQAGAVRLGISRALLEYNAELRKKLKDEGLLTRDARAKERKKYGMAGARKRFQFSKR
jgi:small subunit ribosomal protein S9